MAKSSTNAWTYVTIITLLVIFISTLQSFITDIANNPEVELSEDTLEYIARINRINLTEYTATSSELETDDSDNSNNATGSQQKDFALEFFFARTQEKKITNFIKNIYSFPGYVLILLNAPVESVSWIIEIFNWFWRLGLIFSAYYFIRGVIT